jgi:hypothetical protein
VQEVRYAVAATKVEPESDVIDNRGANSASLKKSSDGERNSNY